jgi:hypothetical protein
MAGGPYVIAGAVVRQAIVHHYGRDELLAQLAHPFWRATNSHPSQRHEQDAGQPEEAADVDRPLDPKASFDKLFEPTEKRLGFASLARRSVTYVKPNSDVFVGLAAASPARR